MTKGAEIPASV